MPLRERVGAACSAREFMSIIYKGLHLVRNYSIRSDAPRVYTGTDYSRTNHTTQNVAWRLFARQCDKVRERCFSFVHVFSLRDALSFAFRNRDFLRTHHTGVSYSFF
jgi:hypothetical protein